MPINPKAALDELLEAYDVTDKDKFYSAMPQPGGMPGQAPNAEVSPNGNGVTNPALAAGPLSPSNQLSQSPVAAMQQLGAMSGGVANAG
jgi:hypothetical protein